MADSNLVFSCGCGLKTGNYLEAAIHADEKNHTLTVSGTVYSDKKAEAKKIKGR